MKHAFFALAALCIAAPACAQTGASAEVVERLRRADSNHDNVVSRQEFVAYRTQHFSRLDRNDDGYITSNEIPRAFLRRAPEVLSLEQLQAQFDANRDGRVSQAEFVNGPTPVFDVVDASDDNLATEAEFNVALEAARARR